MSKTVFITGASTGIGKVTAEYFAKNGWTVIAAMRTPEDVEFTNKENIHKVKIDVTDEDSIGLAVTEALAKFPKVDAVVNNAGYGLVGTFEYSTPEEVAKQFDTNVLGLMSVTRAFLPHFRANKSGIFVNVASMLGQMSLPFFSMYSATKFAVEGFSESLQYELEPFNIMVKIIEPGAIKTDFYSRSMAKPVSKNIAAYDDPYNNVLASINARGENGADPMLVAKIIYKSVTDNSERLRYSVDSTSRLLMNLHRFMPFWLYKRIIRSSVG